MKVLQSKYNYTHFKGKEIKAQKTKMPLPKSHIWQIDQTTTQRLIYTLLTVERYTVGKEQTDVC